MIDRIYVVLMVGLCLLGWLYIIAKAWGWFIGIAFRQWDRRRKLECQQKRLMRCTTLSGLSNWSREAVSLPLRVRFLSLCAVGKTRGSVMKNNPYSENLRIARAQRKKLERIAEKLVDMSSEWEGYDGCMESELVGLADQIHDQLRLYREITECWRKGYAG